MGRGGHKLCAEGKRVPRLRAPPPPGQQTSDHRQAREAWWWSPAVRDLAPGPGTSEQRAPCAWRGLAPLQPCVPTNRFSLCHSWVFSALTTGLIDLGFLFVKKNISLAYGAGRFLAHPDA